jgi:hypothetical protein
MALFGITVGGALFPATVQISEYYDRISGFALVLSFVNPKQRALPFRLTPRAPPPPKYGKMM